MTFFQTAGTLTVDTAADPLGTALHAALFGVTLSEVTIDPDTNESIPVPGGACIEIVDGAIATAAAGDIATAGPGLGVVPIDNGYDGSLASMACATLGFVADGVDTVQDVELELGLSHEYAGDITLKVVSPVGTVVTLLSRPGLAESGDNGTGCCGRNANLTPTSPLVFRALGDTDAEIMGQTLGNDDFICQDDALCDYVPNAGSAASGDLGAFTGESAVGAWQVCMGDSEVDDGAELDSVTLTVTQI